MYPTGYQFLACSVGAGDEYPGFCWGNFVDGLLDFLHAGRLANHLLRLVVGDFLLQHFGFCDEAGLVERIANRDEQTVQVWWFGDKIKGAFFNRFHSSINVGMAGNHDHGGVRCQGLDTFQGLHSVHFRHLDVHQDYIVLRFFQLHEALQPITCFIHLKLLKFKDFFQCTPDGYLVIND